ncbi:aminotransferase class I/II-fold pyridoxal phosphate-dependent enzyme [Streptomyces sp. E11-3]|uniref:aminotransferase class I/II-fold pyridoxal phosphate-dependent enzyme n=1 Tax=Streptomyces sp. E11-3 TaxID=3110112 RepID=UPI00397FFD70
MLPELAAVLAAAAGRAYAEPPGGGPALLDAACGYFGRRGLPGERAQVAAAPGAPLLLLALSAAVGGDVLLPRPCAAWWAPGDRLLGQGTFHVPTPAECGGVPDPYALLETVRRVRAEGGDPRLLVLSVADDPTGTVPPPEVLHEAVEAAAGEGLHIVADETWRDTVHGASDEARQPVQPHSARPSAGQPGTLGHRAPGPGSHAARPGGDSGSPRRSAGESGASGPGAPGAGALDAGPHEAGPSAADEARGRGWSGPARQPADVPGGAGSGAPGTTRPGVPQQSPDVLISPAEMLPGQVTLLTDLSGAFLPADWPAAVARFPDTAAGAVLRARTLDVLTALGAIVAAPVAAAAAHALGEPEEVTARLTAAARLHARVAGAAYRAVRAAGGHARPPQAGRHLYADLEPLRSALGARSVADAIELEDHLTDRLGMPVAGGHRFGDALGALRVRLSTGPLIGATDQERLESLTSPEPLELPHVRRALSMLGSTLDDLRADAREREEAERADAALDAQRMEPPR